MEMRRLEVSLHKIRHEGCCLFWVPQRFDNERLQHGMEMMRDHFGNRDCLFRDVEIEMNAANEEFVYAGATKLKTF